MTHRTSSLLALVAVLALSGCSGISNLRPADGITVPPGPVNMGGEFRSNVNNSLRVVVDGSDMTAAFNPVYSSAPGTFGATLGLSPGSHTMVVSGDFTEYFLIFPAGQRAMTAQTTFTVPGPVLGFSPTSTSTTVGGTTSVVITLSQSQNTPVTINLSAAPGGVVSVPVTTTVAAGLTSSPAVSIGGQAAGTTTLTATAPTFTTATATVTVSPGLTGVAPTQAPVGTSVTLTGTGFVAGATTVSFGGTNSSSVTVSSPTSLTAMVPAGLALGNRPARVTVAGVSSVTQPFAVIAPPVPPAAPVASLFRTSAQDVQTFTFTPASGASPASFALVDTDAATPQGGQSAVGVAQTATRVVRSSTADAQAFTIGTPLSLALGATRGGSGSGTGSAIAISGSTVVRAIDTGIEVSTLNAAGNSLTAFAFVGVTTSATGVAVDITGTTVVRAHSSGIDLFSVSNPAAPTRLSTLGTGAGDLSAVGVGVRFISATRVVRSFPQGVEIYDVSAPNAPTRLTVNRTGFVDSAMGTAVAVEPAGGAVIRATSVGLERYALPLAANTAPTSSMSGRVSTTGVGVVVVGTRAFRATNDRLEAYDLPELGAPVTDIGATVSSVGVGLAGR